MRLIDADALRKQWSADDACEHDYTHLHFLESIDSAPTINQWIPVTERLPEGMGEYLVTVDYEEHGKVVCCRYFFGIGNRWDDDCVTAWMPLPKPYIGSEEE